MKKWYGKNGKVFDPNGNFHITSVDCYRLCKVLNDDIDLGIKQTWMPGVSYFKKEYDPHKHKGLVNRVKRKI